MGFFQMFLISLAFMVIGELLRPKPKIDKPKPSALGDFQFPTAEPTRVIPVFCGTCKFKAPNTPYFGDLEIKPIKKKVKTGLFSSETIIQGYKYYLTVQMTWAWGFVDSFVRLEADDKPVKIKNLVTTADYWAFDMDDPTHMSEDEPANGLTGHVILYRGSTTQPVNAKLQALWAEDQTSPFLMLCHMVMEHCYLGNSDTPPAFSLVMARFPNTLGMSGGKHTFDGDSNPACWCYELMTNRIWGRKMDPTLIDSASFIACGEILYTERMGISMQLDNGVPLRDTLAEILRHIDGVIYPDPVTGKYTMALAREDYDVEDLDELTDADIADDDFEFSRQSWDETKNVITATYTDREHNFQQRPAQYKDSANIDARYGRLDPENIDFLLFSNKENAQKAVARAGKTLSAPLVRCSFYANRKAWDYRPAKVFKMSKQAFGINDLIVRVVDINYGTLDEPRIRLVVSEDIFAVNALAFNPPAPSEWQSPVVAAAAAGAQALFEIPYHLLGAEERRVATVATPTNLSDIGYDTWQDPAGGSAYVFGQKVPAFTPSGVLVNAFNVGNAVDAAGFLVSDSYGLSDLTSTTTDGMYAGVNLALIRSSAGDEMVSWRVVATESGNWRITDVLRGALDSIPLNHPVGGRVWFFSDGVGQLRDTAYSSNVTVSGKLLPYNLAGTLPIASATAMTQALTQRAWKPYPAARIRIDGSSTSTTILGDADVTWAIRHRVQQYTNTAVVAQDAPSYAATPEGVYTLKVYIGGVLRRTVSISAAPFDQFTYTVAMRIADDANKTANVEIGLTAVNGSYSSIERKSQAFYMPDANPVLVTTASLPGGTVGVAYSQNLAASGGISPYTWSITTGSLPPGLTRTGNTISGVPTTPGTYNFTVRATDTLGFFDDQALSITIA